MARRFLLATGLVLFGCASAPPNLNSGTSAQAARAERPQAKKAGANPEMVCEMETPTGSHIAKQVCRRVEDMDRERFEAQDPVKGHIGVPQPKTAAP